MLAIFTAYGAEITVARKVVERECVNSRAFFAKIFTEDFEQMCTLCQT